MKRLNVLYLVLVTSIAFACSEGKKEPLTPSDHKEKKMSMPDKSQEDKQNDKDNGEKQEEPLPSKKENQMKEGFYMLKTIREYQGAKLMDELNFSYDAEAHLERVSSQSLSLHFTYSLLNEALSKVEVHSSKEDELASLTLKLKDGKASSLMSAQLSYANFSYEHKHLKSYVRKAKGDKSETYTYAWTQEGNLSVRAGSFNVEYAYQDAVNKVYPDLNFILNAGETEAYLTDYMLQRSQNLLSSKLSKAGGLKTEERYAYTFDEQGRPIEVRITTIQGETDLGTKTFKLSYF